ncbi:hypothetical protein MFUL124B02_04105 [Myxococcus fulvus 124B02]|nr:hypothetical protein MFUL124B02_04105 [Myxococcus fulvus 124B02]
MTGGDTGADSSEGNVGSEGRWDSRMMTPAPAISRPSRASASTRCMWRM